MLDPSTNTWSDLTNIATGPGPSPRYDHGFASADNKLFVFGGYDFNWFGGNDYSAGESTRGVEQKGMGERSCVRERARGRG